MRVQGTYRYPAGAAPAGRGLCGRAFRPAPVRFRGWADASDRLARLRAVQRCLLVPAAEPGHARAVFVAGGRVAAERTLPPGGGAHLEIEAGLAACRHVPVSDTALDLDELFLIGTFLRRPPAELQIVPHEKDAILRAMPRCQTPGHGRKDQPPRADRTAHARHAGTGETLF